MNRMTERGKRETLMENPSCESNGWAAIATALVLGPVKNIVATSYTIVTKPGCFPNICKAQENVDCDKQIGLY